MKQKISYSATGLVFGNYWGGGKGAYKAQSVEAKTKKAIITKATKMLKDGTLDSGMGYESLIGAMLYITKTTVIDVKGKPFTNKESEVEFIGELSDDDEEFLLSCDY